MLHPSRKNRKAKAAETKNRIYAAAIDLLDHKGFERLTIADISRNAGVSIGAFYHYFDSKNDILEEIFRKADEYFTRVVPQLKQKSVPGRIVEYFDHYALFNVRSGVETTKSIYNAKLRFFVKKRRPLLKLLQELIKLGQERREIRSREDAAEIARFLVTMARGIVFDWSLNEGRYDLKATMHRYMATLVGTIR
jgi:TetR/AcrR family fatty acid metabolism transcriptional regulator